MTVGWETLDVGEKALIFSKDGSSRIEEGPQRIFLFRERFERMTRYSASQMQYLEIKYKNGKQEHRKGPCTEHFNQVVHLSIKVKESLSLSANEALVVYNQNMDTNVVTRKIVYGPALYIIGENEWLHNFCWHGTDPSNKTRMVKEQASFSVLKIIPDQFYYNVDEVRTADDALLRVKLMIFYELTDITKMLNSTKDPIADFINCLCADVIAFASKKKYEEFIETASSLNDLKNFPQLLERCETIGYSVSKVVFRGYFAHDKLQSMHDLMIRKRTELKLKYEREVQEQAMTDLKLQAEVDRLEQEQEIELKNMLHQQEMEKDALKHRMDLERACHIQSLDERRQKNEAELKARIATDTLETDYYQNLSDMNVDVTSLLKAQAGRPAKVTNFVTSGGAAQIHLHHNDPSLQPSHERISHDI